MDQIVKYDVTEAAISEMRSLYMALTVKDIDDHEGCKQVHDARMVVKSKRVLVEKQRKEYKADALDFGRKVDAEAKKIFSLLEPIESHLQAQEDVIINERKRIQSEKEQAEQRRILGRINELASVGCVMSYFDVASLSDPEYEKLFSEKKAAFETEQFRIAEEKRIEAERLEKERIEQEAMRKKMAEEMAEITKIKAEQEAERARLKAEQDKIDATNRAIEEAKRKAQEKLDREAFEKQALENARIAAEKVAKDKAEREAREKAEAEAKAKAEAERIEKLRPDKEKLIAFANAIFKFKNDSIPSLTFGSPAQPILAKAEMAIDKVVKTLIKEAKEL